MQNILERGRSQPLLIIVIALVFAGGGFLAARWLAPRPLPESPLVSAPGLRQYPQPRVIADFALTDQHGQPYNLQRWRGRFNLVFFGFTHCPDICPTTLALLSAAKKQILAGNPELTVGVDFVSVDPERDSPAHLARYVAHFDPEFAAATGPHPQLAALSRQMGIIYSIEPHEPDDRGYQVDHGANILLIDTEARLLGAFPPPHTADAIAQAVLSLAGALR